MYVTCWNCGDIQHYHLIKPVRCTRCMGGIEMSPKERVSTMKEKAKKEYKELGDLLRTLFKNELLNLTVKAIIGQEIERQMEILQMYFEEEEQKKVFRLTAGETVGLTPYMEVESGEQINVNWKSLPLLPMETTISFYNDTHLHTFIIDGVEENIFTITKPIEITEEGDYKICYR